MSDRHILYATCFLRAVATGMLGVQLGIFLSTAGFGEQQAGYVVSAGLAGVALAAAFTTLKADARGRRRLLVELALVGALGAAGLAAASGPFWCGAAAFLGMLNGMGRDRGAALILEQAILPGTAGDEERTRVFAWYNVVQDAGHALGVALAAMPALLHRAFDVPRLTGHRAGLGLYAALLLASAALYLALSRRVESAAPRAPLVSAPSRRILLRITALFGLDSVAGGFLTSALLTFFFFERFGAGEGAIAALFLGARILNAVSHLGAAWLARRIGLVRTMVFTHIPSSLLLMTVALAPSFEVAAVLFLLREGLVEMDVPTRQSYVMAVVRPEERVFASGVTNLVRVGGWAVGPALAGLLMAHVAPAAPIVVGPALKITYDILLYVAFRAVRPPEEGGRGGR